MVCGWHVTGCINKIGLCPRTGGLVFGNLIRLAILCEPKSGREYEVVFIPLHGADRSLRPVKSAFPIRWHLQDTEKKMKTIRVAARFIHVPVVTGLLWGGYRLSRFRFQSAM